MSGKITGIVWESDLPQNEKFVLLAYADHADHDGNNIFPSIALIAWKTGYSERNIKRIKKDLITKKYILETGIKASGTPVYRINIELLPMLPQRGDNLSPPSDNLSPPSDKLSPPSDKLSPGGDTIVSPEPSINLFPPHDKKEDKLLPEEMDSEIPKSEFELLQDSILEVCQIAMTEDNRGKVYKATRAAQNKGRRPDDILAFGKWFNTEFWRGKNPTPAQIGEHWPKFEAFQNNGSGESDFSRAAKAAADMDQAPEIEAIPGWAKFLELAGKQLPAHVAGMLQSANVGLIDNEFMLWVDNEAAAFHLSRNGTMATIRRCLQSTFDQAGVKGVTVCLVESKNGQD